MAEFRTYIGYADPPAVAPPPCRILFQDGKPGKDWTPALDLDRYAGRLAEPERREKRPMLSGFVRPKAEDKRPPRIIEAHCEKAPPRPIGRPRTRPVVVPGPRRRPTRHDITVEVIQKLRSEGLNYSQIAVRLKCERTVISLRMRRIGIRATGKWEEAIPQIEPMLLKGMSSYQIGAAIGMDPSSVRHAWAAELRKRARAEKREAATA